MKKVVVILALIVASSVFGRGLGTSVLQETYPFCLYDGELYSGLNISSNYENNFFRRILEHERQPEKWNPFYYMLLVQAAAASFQVVVDSGGSSFATEITKNTLKYSSKSQGSQLRKTIHDWVAPFIYGSANQEESNFSLSDLGRSNLVKYARRIRLASKRAYNERQAEGRKELVEYRRIFQDSLNESFLAWLDDNHERVAHLFASVVLKKCQFYPSVASDDPNLHLDFEMLFAGHAKLPPSFLCVYFPILENLIRPGGSKQGQYMPENLEQERIKYCTFEMTHSLFEKSAQFEPISSEIVPLQKKDSRSGAVDSSSKKCVGWWCSLSGTFKKWVSYED